MTPPVWRISPLYVSLNLADLGAATVLGCAQVRRQGQSARLVVELEQDGVLPVELDAPLGLTGPHDGRDASADGPSSSIRVWRCSMCDMGCASTEDRGIGRPGPARDGSAVVSPRLSIATFVTPPRSIVKGL
jgi:hypothetical protein